jgi:hypothetical protein
MCAFQYTACMFHPLQQRALLRTSRPHPHASAAGVVKYGQPLSLDDKLKVDLIVVGSVAVDPETGCRWAGPGGQGGREQLDVPWRRMTKTPQLHYPAGHRCP